MTVVKTLTWAIQMLQMKVSQRTKTRKLCLDHIENFKRGKPSDEGTTLVESLKKDFQFIGFSPNVYYIKEKGPANDLNVMWVHPFSTPALLFKHKKLPCLLITNGNIEFNSSRLKKIKANNGLDNLDDILGITG